MTTSYQIERRKRGPIGWVFLVLFWAFNAFMLISLLSGVSNVSTHYDSLTTSAEKSGAAIGTSIGITMLLGLWMAGAVILGIFVLLTRGPKVIETVAGSGSAAPSPPQKLRWWHWGLIAVGVIVVIAIATPRPAPVSGETPPQSTAQIVGEEAVPTPPPSNWTHTSERDEMRNATNRFATTRSTNVENFGFPYNEVRMEIMLRDSAQHGRDILLLLTEGQYQCRYDGCTISVKFDDGEIQRFSVNEAAGGRSDALFIVNQQRFLSALRQAERVTIEAQFFQVGSQQFTFNVGGLEWE